MKLHYHKYLKPYSQKLRQAGNLSEVILWHVLGQNQLGHRFLRQRPIENYIVDFFCHKLNLIIEIDGAASHNTKIELDIIRQNELESLGFEILRFKDSDIRYNLEGVELAIKSKISQLVNKNPPAFGHPL